MTTMTIAQHAASFLELAAEQGFTVSAKPGVVTIRKSFIPGDRDAYVECDMDGPSILARVPIVGAGSTWGTDGATVGGYAGLTGGYYRLNRSGVSKRFTTALAKLLA